MRTLAFAIASAALVLGPMVPVAGAQTFSSGIASVPAQTQNATPIIRTGCGGGWGFCPPYKTKVCGHYHCWCRPCG